MARTGDPHSATAQFFINVADNGFLNHTSPSAQGWGYAVFGKVVKGTEIVDKLRGVKTGRNGGHQDVPKDDVIIERPWPCNQAPFRQGGCPLACSRPVVHAHGPPLAVPMDNSPAQSLPQPSCSALAGRAPAHGPDCRTSPSCVPPIAAEWTLPAAWRTLDFISDLHLQACEPATVQAFRRYLHATQADAVFLLGDLFEVWVGDDALLDPGSFEADCAATLREAAARRPLFFMQGNRDFLTGAQFDALCGTTTLADPTVLDCGDQRILLSHGDALCLDDTDYQRFRAMARSAAWQAAFLAQPLPLRREQARGIRQESESRKRESAGADAAAPPPATPPPCPPMPTWMPRPRAAGCAPHAPPPWSTATRTARPTMNWAMACGVWCSATGIWQPPCRAPKCCAGSRARACGACRCPKYLNRRPNDEPLATTGPLGPAAGPPRTLRRLAGA